jgi:Flp pilus assembly pilin Flp
MTAVIVMFVGIALVGTVVTVLDWLARRKEQQPNSRPRT